MKNGHIGKRLTSLILAAVMVFSMPGVSSLASAEEAQTAAETEQLEDAQEGYEQELSVDPAAQIQENGEPEETSGASAEGEMNTPDTVPDLQESEPLPDPIQSEETASQDAAVPASERTEDEGIESADDLVNNADTMTSPDNAESEETVVSPETEKNEETIASSDNAESKETDVSLADAENEDTMTSSDNAESEEADASSANAESAENDTSLADGENADSTIGDNQEIDTDAELVSERETETACSETEHSESEPELESIAADEYLESELLNDDSSDESISADEYIETEETSLELLTAAEESLEQMMLQDPSAYHLDFGEYGSAKFREDALIISVSDVSAFESLVQSNPASINLYEYKDDYRLIGNWDITDLTGVPSIIVRQRTSGGYDPEKYSYYALSSGSFNRETGELSFSYQSLENIAASSGNETALRCIFADFSYHVEGDPSANFGGTNLDFDWNKPISVNEWRNGYHYEASGSVTGKLHVHFGIDVSLIPFKLASDITIEVTGEYNLTTKVTNANGEDCTAPEMYKINLGQIGEDSYNYKIAKGGVKSGAEIYFNGSSQCSGTVWSKALASIGVPTEFEFKIAEHTIKDNNTTFLSPTESELRIIFLPTFFANVLGGAGELRLGANMGGKVAGKKSFYGEYNTLKGLAPHDCRECSWGKVGYVQEGTFGGKLLYIDLGTAEYAHMEGFKQNFYHSETFDDSKVMDYDKFLTDNPCPHRSYYQAEVQVLDWNGLPLSKEATVTVSNEANPEGKTYQTDKTGKLVLEEITEKTDTFTAGYRGLKSEPEEHVFTGKEKETITLQLESEYATYTDVYLHFPKETDWEFPTSIKVCKKADKETPAREVTAKNVHWYRYNENNELVAEDNTAIVSGKHVVMFDFEDADGLLLNANTDLTIHDTDYYPEGETTTDAYIYNVSNDEITGQIRIEFIIPAVEITELKLALPFPGEAGSELAGKGSTTDIQIIEAKGYSQKSPNELLDYTYYIHEWAGDLNQNAGNVSWNPCSEDWTVETDSDKVMFKVSFGTKRPNVRFNDNVYVTLVNRSGSGAETVKASGAVCDDGETVEVSYLFDVSGKTTHHVTVNGAIGSGDYAAGECVPLISMDLEGISEQVIRKYFGGLGISGLLIETLIGLIPSSLKQKFVKWEVVLPDDGSLVYKKDFLAIADGNFAVASFVMPDQDVEINAVYGETKKITEVYMDVSDVSPGHILLPYASSETEGLQNYLTTKVFPDKYLASWANGIIPWSGLSTGYDGEYSVAITFRTKPGYEFAGLLGMDTTGYIRSGNGEYVKADKLLIFSDYAMMIHTFQTPKAQLLEVTQPETIYFPNGTTQDVINNYLKNQLKIAIRTEDADVKSTYAQWAAVADLDNGAAPADAYTYDSSKPERQEVTKGSETTVAGKIILPNGIGNDQTTAHAEVDQSVRVRIVILEAGGLEPPQADPDRGEFANEVSVELALKEYTKKHHPSAKIRYYVAKEGSSASEDWTEYKEGEKIRLTLQDQSVQSEKYTIHAKAVLAKGEETRESDEAVFTYTIKKEETTYKVTVKKGYVKVTGTDEQAQEWAAEARYKAGDQVTLKALPGEGQRFSMWDVDNQKMVMEWTTEQFHDPNVTFTMPDGDAVITALFDDDDPTKCSIRSMNYEIGQPKAGDLLPQESIIGTYTCNDVLLDSLPGSKLGITWRSDDPENRNVFVAGCTYTLFITANIANMTDGETHQPVVSKVRFSGALSGYINKNDSAEVYVTDGGMSATAVYTFRIKDTYTVSYRANDEGKGSAVGVPAEKTYDDDQDAVIDTAVPKMSGYEFLGWSLSADGEVQLQPGSAYTGRESITLYAVWDYVKDKYTVSYDKHLPDTVTVYNMPEAQKELVSNELTLSKNRPKAEGYTFIGWNTSQDETGKMYEPGDLYTDKASVTLYAMWDKVLVDEVDLCMPFPGNQGEKLAGVSDAELTKILPEQFEKDIQLSEIKWYTYDEAGTLVENTGSEESGKPAAKVGLNVAKITFAVKADKPDTAFSQELITNISNKEKKEETAELQELTISQDGKTAIVYVLFYVQSNTISKITLDLPYPKKAGDSLAGRSAGEVVISEVIAREYLEQAEKNITKDFLSYTDQICSENGSISWDPCSLAWTVSEDTDKEVINVTISSKSDSYLFDRKTKAYLRDIAGSVTNKASASVSEDGRTLKLSYTFDVTRKTTYHVTVHNAVGDGDYAPGEMVPLVSYDIEGMAEDAIAEYLGGLGIASELIQSLLKLIPSFLKYNFKTWKVLDPTDGTLVYKRDFTDMGSGNYKVTAFEMPAHDVEIEAEYGTPNTVDRVNMVVSDTSPGSFLLPYASSDTEGISNLIDKGVFDDKFLASWAKGFIPWGFLPTSYNSSYNVSILFRTKDGYQFDGILGLGVKGYIKDGEEKEYVTADALLPVADYGMMLHTFKTPKAQLLAVHDPQTIYFDNGTTQEEINDYLKNHVNVLIDTEESSSRRVKANWAQVVDISTGVPWENEFSYDKLLQTRQVVKKGTEMMVTGTVILPGDIRNEETSTHHVVDLGVKIKVVIRDAKEPELKEPQADPDGGIFENTDISVRLFLDEETKTAFQDAVIYYYVQEKGAAAPEQITWVKYGDTQITLKKPEEPGEKYYAIHAKTVVEKDGKTVRESDEAAFDYTLRKKQLQYVVNVNNGSVKACTADCPPDCDQHWTASAQFNEGDTVCIKAEVGRNEEFTEWTADEGTAADLNKTAAQTTFTMPAENVTVSAHTRRTDGKYEITQISYSIEKPEYGKAFAAGITSGSFVWNNPGDRICDKKENEVAITWSPEDGTAEAGKTYLACIRINISELHKSSDPEGTSSLLKDTRFSGAVKATVNGQPVRVVVTGDYQTATVFVSFSMTNRFTIRYFPNDQDKGYARRMPGAKQFFEDQEAYISDVIPTLEGYTFKGWALSADGKAVYQPGGAYTRAEDLDLYAVWEAVPEKYSVNYQANAPEGVTVTNLPALQTENKGTNLYITKQQPAADGYVFTGWNTLKDGKGTAYRSGDLYKGQSDLTLYAQWKQGEPAQFRIQYKANAGSAHVDRLPEDQTKEEGRSISFSELIPVRDGYDFVIWNTSADGKGISYQPGSVYKEDADLTLYAVWIKAHTMQYEIIYDANASGDTVRDVPAKQYKKEKIDLTLSSLYPKRDEYEFLGWAEDPSAEDVQYRAGDVYTEDKDITLYAVWLRTSDQEYYVRYDANGGDGEPSIQSEKAGRDIILSSQIPVRKNHIFRGWALTKAKADRGEWDYLASGIFRASQGVTTLYAAWKETGYYTITYDACADEIESQVQNLPDEQNTKNDQDTMISRLVPTAQGYLFLGWSTDRSRASKLLVDYEPGDSYTDRKDITLYAAWQKSPVLWTLRYDANGGTGAPDEQMQIAGESMTVSRVIPEKKDSTFMGWALEKDADTAAFVPGDNITPKQSITVLYAVWSKESEETFTVRYDANGGEEAPEPQTGSVNGFVRLSRKKPVHQDELKIFTGWAISQERAACGQVDYLGSSLFMGTSPREYTLYAVWEEYAADHHIYYDGNAEDAFDVPQPTLLQHGVETAISSQYPQRENGYLFVGWAKDHTQASDSIAAYQPGDLYEGSPDEDVTLYAVWIDLGSLYLIIYDDNTSENDLSTADAGISLMAEDDASSDSGVSGPDANAANMPDAELGIKGYPHILSEKIPQLPGYIFTGWSRNRLADVGEYRPLSILRDGDGIVKLYAIWAEETDAYRLSFDGNAGGDTVENVPDAQPIVKGSSVLISEEKPLRQGYSFRAWGTTPQFTKSTVFYGCKELYHCTEDKDVTLYAYWLEDKEESYTVTYDKNCSESVTGMPENQSEHSGKAITISDLVPVRAEYVFVGWSKDKNASGASYLPGDLFTENEDTVLYAVWSRVKHYKVTYNKNCDDAVANMPSQQDEQVDKDVVLSSLVPSRAGYDFLGWAEKPASQNADFQAGDLYTGRTDITLYALWKEKGPGPDPKPDPQPETYTITYDQNCQDTVSNMPSPQTIDTDRDAVLSKKEPERTGYIFRGWAKTADAEAAEYHAGDRYTDRTDLTLYALWQEKAPDPDPDPDPDPQPKTYTITYDQNCQDAVSNMPSPQTIDTDRDAVLSVLIPVRTGYVFKGWMGRSDAAAADYQAGATYTGRADIRLYALWSKNDADPTPKTGDNSPICLWMLMALLCMWIMSVTGRKLLVQKRK